MASFRPSAPPFPTPSSSSNPNYNPNPIPNPIYNPNFNYNQNSNYPPPAQSYHVGLQPYSSSSSGPGYSPFPPGTDPEIIRSFQAVDRDRNGCVEDYELQNALSFGYHRFNLRTVRLLISLYKNPNQSFPRIGPGEFAALWRSLGEWRAIFDKFDRDRCGKINADELNDALHSLGYAVPLSVLKLLISYYDNGSRLQVLLDFDSFVECGTIVRFTKPPSPSPVLKAHANGRGLTEKFKEKDTQYSGSATLTYDDFMSMVLPFLVTYN